MTYFLIFYLSLQTEFISYAVFEQINLGGNRVVRNTLAKKKKKFKAYPFK